MLVILGVAKLKGPVELCDVVEYYFKGCYFDYALNLCQMMQRCVRLTKIHLWSGAAESAMS